MWNGIDNVEKKKEKNKLMMKSSNEILTSI
jgi:hypothetical protein